jgi:hypothetical protein
VGLVHPTCKLDTSPRTIGQTGLKSLLALFVPLLIATGVAHAACRVEARGTVPLQLIDGHILVTVQVNDSPATFILDTGAQRTLMGDDVVRERGIARDTWVASTVFGIGGYEERPNALPRSLRLGDVSLRRHTLIGDTSVTVGPLPVRDIAGQQIAGLLGRDFLSPFDLDIDLPDHRLTLYDVGGCTTGFLPWTMPYAAIPAATSAGEAMVIDVAVDGRPLRALIDTGASASLLTRSGMFRLGLTPQVLARDPGADGSGIGPAPVAMHYHRFDQLRVGPDTMPNPSLWAAPVQVVPIVDMLLGTDWLRSRHIWLSFATRQLFVAVHQR